MLEFMDTMFSHEAAFPFPRAIVLCHLRDEKTARCVLSLWMTKSNMFLRKCLTY